MIIRPRIRLTGAGTLAAVGAVVISAVLIAPVGAAAPKIASTVHMHGVGPDPEYDSWVGDVHSRKRKCERGRTVVVIYEESPTPFEVGSDVTDRLGHWRVEYEFSGTDDPYYAVVRKKVIGTGDDRIVCKADRSPDFGVAV